MIIIEDGIVYDATVRVSSLVFLHNVLNDWFLRLFILEYLVR